MSNYNHVAFLVADLEAAIARFSQIFQVAFNPPSTMLSNMLRDGVRIEEEVRVTYSRTEPYIELIEAKETGYFALSQGEGFHHIGTWAAPFGCTMWQDRFGTLAVEAQLLSGADLTTTLTDPASCHGVRVEAVDEGRRAQVEAWIHREP